MTSLINKPSVTVWDLFIRIFHWTLVLAFVTSYLTEGDIYLHFYSGSYIVILLGLRVIWGVIGSKHARFIDFIKSPTEITAYVKSLTKGGHSVKRYLGHNPLGGLMVVALLISLSLTCTSGFLLYIENGNNALSFMGHSPIAEFEEHGKGEDEHRTSSDDAMSNIEHTEGEAEEFWEEIHELSTNLTLILIFFHIAGVLISSRLHHENLVKSMITGKK